MKNGKTERDTFKRGLMSQLTISEYEIDRVLYLVRHDLPQLYVLPFCLFVFDYYKKKYLATTTVIMLFLIFVYDWPLISFFMPLIPIGFIYVFSIFEINKVTNKMNRLHNQLIAEQISITWDNLMDFVLIVISERYFKDEDNDNINTNTFTPNGRH